jgi:hypothetical protein
MALFLVSIVARRRQWQRRNVEGLAGDRVGHGDGASSNLVVAQAD